MRLALIILGALFVLVGGVWILQGTDVLTRGAMAGHSQWTTWGGLLAAVGVAAVVVGAMVRRPRKA